jgi:hypothetical protein
VRLVADGAVLVLTTKPPLMLEAALVAENGGLADTPADRI